MNDVSGDVELAVYQRNDPSLAPCWEMAKAKRGTSWWKMDYFITTTKSRVKRCAIYVFHKTKGFRSCSWLMILCLVAI